MTTVRQGLHAGLSGALAIAGLLAAGCGGRQAEVRDVLPDTLNAWIERAVPAAVFDLRPDSLYRAGHVPGAIPAHGKTLNELREVLPRNPVTPLVFYDQSGELPPGDGDPAHRAVAYGFRLVLWLRGGYAGWSASGQYPVDGFIPVPPSR